MVPTSRPQERTVSLKRHPAYLRESQRQPATLLRAYDGPQERTPPTWRSPLLRGRGLSHQQGSIGQEARHAPPNKPRPTPLLSARDLIREGQLHHSMEGGHPTHMPHPPNDQPTNHKPSYAEVAACGIGAKLDKTTTHGGWQHVHRRRRPTSERRPINPSMKGRCYRCLARGHQAQLCREPVQCRLCRQARHRQYACPHDSREATHPKPLQRAPHGLYACLVGEITHTEPNWTQILDCIQEISPSSTHSACHRLACRHVLLRTFRRRSDVRFEDGGTVSRKADKSAGDARAPQTGRIR